MNIFHRFLSAIGLKEIRERGAIEHDLRQSETALRASEERFVSAFENAPIGMALVSPEGRWLKVNRATCDLIGYSHEELMNKTFQDITHPDDLESDLKNVQELLAGKIRSYRMEKRYFHKQGHVVWALLSVSLVRDAQGKPVHFISQIQDISEAKLSADKVRRSEAMLNSAQRVARFGSWEADLIHPIIDPGNPLYWSDEVFRIFGYKPREIEVSNENFFRAVHPDDREPIRQAVGRALQDGSHYEIEHRIILPNGEIRHVREEAEIIRDPVSKTPRRMVGVVQDITERKLAEQKLRELATLIDEARDGIILRDLEHNILFWNKGAERLYGWTAAEVMGRKTTEFIYRGTARIGQAMQAVIDKGEWVGEMESLAKSGNPLIIECRWTLLRDTEGQPKSILCINTDITERKKMEGQFLRSQRMESIGTLAGGIAHDLNNLLSPIIMGVDLLRLHGLDSPSLRVLDDIERSARRGSNLVRQVLSFARGVQGARISVHMDGVVNEIASMIRNTFPKNIVLEINSTRETWLVTGDPTQLNQVMLNLCVNSRDAMPEGGKLTLTSENICLDGQSTVLPPGTEGGRYVVTQVTDTGCGIPGENIHKIFDPFFTTKELGKGTGLGLATTLGIVRSHGGFIDVDSQTGKGTTFKIYLPAQDDETISSLEDMQVNDWPRGNGEWILVVDDEASILTITRQTLEAFGYRVLTAEDGAQALGLYARNRDKVALVLTDMMMPVMDGPAMIVELLKIEPELKIIAASGFSTNANVVQATHAGVKHFLTKPYTTHSLLLMIREVLAARI